MGAEITLSSTETNFSQVVKSDDSGGFHFVSLAPGPYEIVHSAGGFTQYKVQITLTTFQTLNVPITLSLAKTASSIEVTGESPVLDTAETRNQQTIQSKAARVHAPVQSESDFPHLARPRCYRNGHEHDEQFSREQLQLERSDQRPSQRPECAG